MPSQQYQRVAARDTEPTRSHTRNPSTTSSSHSPVHRPVNPDLVDAFGSDSESSDDEDAARQRLVRRVPTGTSLLDTELVDGPVSRTVPPPTAARTGSSGRVYGGGMSSDGVFSNLAAKPDGNEEKDELPPTYEQAAADQAPPYWETTIMAPFGTDAEVYIDGLPVGNIFSFLWNAVVSWSFQLIGFLLTFLLHSTHAAKHGSRVGLGVTLIQYGISMKDAAVPPTPEDGNSGNSEFPTPPDPNSFHFKPEEIANAGGGIGEWTGTEWFAYGLMVVGWFLVVRSTIEFIQARRHEQLVLQSPERQETTPEMVV